MVLVDTNVIIDYWNNPTDFYTDIFKKETIAICGPVQAELIHGAVSIRDINRINRAISCFKMLQYESEWNELGKMLYTLRMSGYTLPFTDVMIAQICMKNNASILTKDKHFLKIKDCFPDLMMYDIEEE